MNQGVKAQVADEIANGNLDVEVDVAGQKDSLGNSMLKMIDSLKLMDMEVQNLTKAALKGQLDTRADSAAYKGSYGKLVEGINELLNAIVAPIQESAKVLKSAAEKDLTKRVEGTYQGQLDELKENINITVEALESALNQVSSSVTEVSDSVDQMNNSIDQLNSASNQIASGSQNLAEGGQ